jgi:hypothetical protein
VEWDALAAGSQTRGTRVESLTSFGWENNWTLKM